MKKSIFVAFALIAVTTITSPLFAQVSAAKNAGYDLKKNVKCRVISTETGCTIVFENAEAPENTLLTKKGYNAYKSKSEFSVSSLDNSVSEVVSPRDAASGLPTGKRQHKPMTITKELDKSSPKLAESVSSPGSGGGAGKVSMHDMTMSKATFKEFTVTKRCGGKSSKITMIDGEYMIPTGDCPDGSCTVTTSWSCDASNSSRCSVDFLLEIVDGVCVARSINESGVSVKSTTKK